MVVALHVQKLNRFLWNWLQKRHVPVGATSYKKEFIYKTAKPPKRITIKARYVKLVGVMEMSVLRSVSRIIQIMVILPWFYFTLISKQKSLFTFFQILSYKCALALRFFQHIFRHFLLVQYLCINSSMYTIWQTCMYKSTTRVSYLHWYFKIGCTNQWATEGNENINTYKEITSNQSIPLTQCVMHCEKRRIIFHSSSWAVHLAQN